MPSSAILPIFFQDVISCKECYLFFFQFQGHVSPSRLSSNLHPLHINHIKVIKNIAFQEKKMGKFHILANTPPFIFNAFSVCKIYIQVRENTLNMSAFANNIHFSQPAVGLSPNQSSKTANINRQQEIHVHSFLR